MPRLTPRVRFSIAALVSAVAVLGACSDDNAPTTAPEAADGPPSLAVSVSSGNFQQCGNGGAGGEPCIYINGVLNDSKSLYHESDVIAQRFVIPGLTAGHTYRLVFDYGWEKAVNPGHMNYDFVAGWNATLGPLANPCGDPLGNGSADIRGVCNANGTVKATHGGANAGVQVIPDGIFTANAPLELGAELQAALDRFQTARGNDAARFDILGGSLPAGAFDNVTYSVSGDNVTARFTVRFVAGQSTVMLLWGGHFADGRDYRASVWDDDKNAGTPQRQGNLTGAAGQSGAPFHFTQQYIKNLNSGDSTGIGSLSNNVQGSVLEPVPKAKIAIAASATNGIGEPHTFTVTVHKDLDNGAGYVAASDGHVDVTLTATNGAVVQLDAAASTCNAAGTNTNASGQCTVVFTSNSAGTVTGSASATLSLGGVSVPVSTDGLGDNSSPAVKTFVAGTLRWLKHDATGQLLGGAVFTVCRTHLWDSDPNGGAGGQTDITPDVCFDVSDNVSNANNTNAPPADRDGTGGEFELGGLILGRYTVTEKTAPAGYILDPDTENAELSTTTPNISMTTAFVNRAPTAGITIAAGATNGIGEAHTFTVTLQKDLDNGAGVVPAAGEHVDVTLTATDGAVVQLNAGASTCNVAGANTNASGQCTVVFTSNSAGKVTGSATATMSLGGVSRTVTTDGSQGNSSPAVKLFVAGTLRWLKQDGAGQLLGGAVFTVCRTHVWDSDLNGGAGGYTAIAPSPVCVDVSDNVSTTNNTNAPPADRDGTGGEFELGGLILGRYTVTEKTAPAGYVLDPDTETRDLSTTASSATISTAFVNPKPDARIDLSPLTATNNVTEDHEVTATVGSDDGLKTGGDGVDGFAPAPNGTTVTFSLLANTAGAVFKPVAGTTCTTTGGTCKITITSNTPGSVDIHATTTFSVNGVSLTRSTGTPGNSANANKLYVAPLLRITKTPDGGIVQTGGRAEFTITVKNDAPLVGGGTAKDVQMTDTLPTGLTWTATVDDAKCAIGSVVVNTGKSHNVIGCNIGSLAPQQSFSITVFSNVIPSGFIQLPPSTLTDAIEVKDDGDLDDDAGKAGNDWKTLPADVFNCATSVGCKTDTESGSLDNSLGNGTKEDDATPSVVDGGIPPNKSDLRRLYVAQERIGLADYLYLGWTRVQDPSGTTNMDFELNQSTAKLPNGIPVRTNGDILVRYDLSNGGTNPQLSYHKWVQTGPKIQCEAANSTPCWGKQLLLTNDVAAAINSGPITDAGGGQLSARTFGEASINLANFFTGGTCQSFGQAYLKSRSSDAFGSAMKDFIAPMPVKIETCKPVDVNNTAFARASNFAPAAGTLNGWISDEGSITVIQSTATLNVAPTNMRLAQAGVDGEVTAGLVAMTDALVADGRLEVQRTGDVWTGGERPALHGEAELEQPLRDTAAGDHPAATPHTARGRGAVSRPAPPSPPSRSSPDTSTDVVI